MIAPATSFFSGASPPSSPRCFARWPGFVVCYSLPAPPCTLSSQSTLPPDTEKGRGELNTCRCCSGGVVVHCCTCASPTKLLLRKHTHSSALHTRMPHFLRTKKTHNISEEPRTHLLEKLNEHRRRHPSPAAVTCPHPNSDDAPRLAFIRCLDRGQNLRKGRVVVHVAHGIVALRDQFDADALWSGSLADEKPAGYCGVQGHECPQT